jgi:hypothetical protein
MVVFEGLARISAFLVKSTLRRLDGTNPATPGTTATKPAGRAEIGVCLSRRYIASRSAVLLFGWRRRRRLIELRSVNRNVRLRRTQLYV